MADEISFSVSLKATKSSFVLPQHSTADTVDMATAGQAGGVQTVGTTHETIGVTDLSTPGWSYFKNLDTTNYVELGRDVSASFYPFVKLLPGEACVLRLGTTAPYAKANTASVKLQYVILET